MTLGNMRELGVRGPAVYCLNSVCRHQTAISVDDRSVVLYRSRGRGRVLCSR